MELAESTSGVGALVLGIRLGALFAAWVGPAAGFVTLGVGYEIRDLTITVADDIAFSHGSAG
jgi:hypothetical protein